MDLQENGERAHQIDWKRSVLLNLVTQTTYSLTVCACQREQLQLIGSSQPSSKDTVEVSCLISKVTSLTNNQHFSETLKPQQLSTSRPPVEFRLMTWFVAGNIILSCGNELVCIFQSAQLTCESLCALVSSRLQTVLLQT